MNTLKSFYAGFFKNFRDIWVGTSFWTIIRRGFLSFFKEFYWEHKYAWQRAWRGYDSTDIFNMSDNLRGKLIVMLERYDETRNCLFTKPYSPEELKNVTNEDIIMTNEETSDVIQKMICLLRESDEDFYLDEHYEIKDGYTYETVNAICKKNLSEFFNLFELYWDQLWD